MKDLTNLNEAGAAGVVLGMALYTGALDAAAVALEYGT
jgi:phosphoribosylformimino-5-aminoimidazole carboxamide ribonucleotide (ProFAR) isomerase